MRKVFVACICLTLAACSTYKISSHKIAEENYVWIYHYAGIQCGVNYFPDMTAAQEFMALKGINVISSKELNLMTRAACGYPTSLRFALKIKEADLQTALESGWKLIVDKEVIKRFGLY